MGGRRPTAIVLRANPIGLANGANANCRHMAVARLAHSKAVIQAVVAAQFGFKLVMKFDAMTERAIAALSWL